MIRTGGVRVHGGDASRAIVRAAMNTATTPPPSVAPLLPARLVPPAAVVHEAPFRFLVATQMLEPGAREALLDDFPRYAGAGFFPYEDADCGPSVRALVAALNRPEVADALGAQIGLPRLGSHPTLVTLCRSLNSRHGNVHTDSLSKIATALVYLEPEWPHGSAGALRFVARADDVESLVAPEIPPVYGNFAIFRRADNSFHGHRPFEGERRVIQIAWLTSESEKLRKTRRGRFSRLVKRLVGALDRRWGRR
jgi:hypothetical protein